MRVWGVGGIYNAFTGVLLASVSVRGVCLHMLLLPPLARYR